MVVSKKDFSFVVVIIWRAICTSGRVTELSRKEEKVEDIGEKLECWETNVLENMRNVWSRP